DERQSAPYNLLATRRWMLLVPRGCERYESISVNALGFAGSLFVRSDVELERVRDAGPMAVLRAVTLE
ncbi:MAG: phosphorylase, partial [Burkholderiales bacterium]